MNMGEVFMDNAMILNNKNIGISCAELNEDDLLVYSIDNKYCFKVYIRGSWKDIRNIKVGEKKPIEFSEVCISENNVPALILPNINSVEKISEDELLFYFKCDNFNDIVYMAMKNHFDIELENLEVRILFNIKDFVNNKIIYKF